MEIRFILMLILVSLSPGNFKPRRVVVDDGLLTVNQLIDPVTKTWKEEVVTRTFYESHAKGILDVPLSWTDECDKLVWHFSRSGKYTVNSGYMAAADLESQRAVLGDGSGSSSNAETDEKRWRQLWKLPIPKKIFHFLWKCFHEILATKGELCRKKISTDPICPVCGEEAETIIHLFCTCPVAKQVWTRSSSRLNLGSAQLLRNGSVHNQVM